MYKLEMPEEKRPIPTIAKITFVILIVSIIALVVLIGIQAPTSSTQAGAFEFVQVTQEYQPGQDIVIGVNNATLYVPGDAIKIQGSIAIFPREPNLFTPPNDTTWVRPLVVNVEFRDGEGKPVPEFNFAKPAEICFRITDDRWKDYSLHRNEYEVQTYAEEKEPPVWEPLPLVTRPENVQLCGQTDHLSVFALATKPETIIPLTGPTPTRDPARPPSNPDNNLPGNNNNSGGLYEP
jgi:hypothetical protein